MPSLRQLVSGIYIYILTHYAAAAAGGLYIYIYGPTPSGSSCFFPLLYIYIYLHTACKKIYNIILPPYALYIQVQRLLGEGTKLKVLPNQGHECTLLSPTAVTEGILSNIASVSKG